MKGVGSTAKDTSVVGRNEVVKERGCELQKNVSDGWAGFMRLTGLWWWGLERKRMQDSASPYSLRTISPDTPGSRTVPKNQRHCCSKSGLPGPLFHFLRHCPNYLISLSSSLLPSALNPVLPFTLQGHDHSTFTPHRIPITIRTFIFASDGKKVAREYLIAAWNVR